MGDDLMHDIVRIAEILLAGGALVLAIFGLFLDRLNLVAAAILVLAIAVLVILLA